MSETSWSGFFVLVIINLAGLWLGLTTRVDSASDDPRALMFRRMARNTGLIVGIGGWLPAIMMLMDLLKNRR
jgi:hypothetical protein